MKRKTPATRIIAVLILFLLLSASIAVSVFAYNVKNTGDVTNSFTPAEEVDPTIEESFNNYVKENVKVKVGDTNYPVYVRAAIVVNWLDSDGNTVFGNDDDYTLTLNLNGTNGWVLRDDGYYYYQTPVKSGEETDVLIKKCEPTNKTGEYSLHVEIAAQTVQAVGSTDEDNSSGVIPAYQDAWGIS